MEQRQKFFGNWRKPDGYCMVIDRHNDQIVVTIDGSKATNIIEVEDGIEFDWPNREWGRAKFKSTSNSLLSQHKTRWVKVPPFLPSNEIRQFRQQGFLVIRGAVSQDLIRKAKRAILSDIGRHGIPPDRIREFNAQSFVPDLRNDPMKSHSLSDVFKASTVPLVLAALLDDKPSSTLRFPWESEGHAPQVALRFPSHPDDDSYQPPSISGPHIDGVPTPDNGLVGSKLHSFTALTGIALTDQTQDYCGNLVVYPGSHVKVGEKLRQQWDGSLHFPVEDRILGPQPIPGSTWSLEEVYGNITPVQLKLQAGDAVICHYNLIHCVAENRGDEVRMQLYHRIRVAQHATASLLHTWHDYHPILHDEFNPLNN
eukprot:gene29993-39175_t